jgi:phosphoadenosine phosphosulfate reductase
VKVLLIDTGYNTPNTYRYASTLVDKLALNVITYIPCQTVAFRDVALGIPDVDDPKHVLFTKQVKLEPFARAMKEINPDLWFTNLRRGQTAFRDSIDIVSKNSDGLIKVSPFYNWSDQQLDEYLAEHSLPNELKYYDPTKQIANRECGLHS